MDALKVLEDVVTLCQEAPAEECPHLTLQHVTRHENEEQAEIGLLQMAAETLTLAQMTGQDPTPALAHIVLFAIATGYALGASDAYDVTLSAEVIVPDSLAALDHIGPAIGERD